MFGLPTYVAAVFLLKLSEIPCQVIEQNSVKLKKQVSDKKKGGESVKTTNWDLKFIVVICHVDGPGKLLTLGFVVDFLNGNAPLLTPRRQKQAEMRSALFKYNAPHCITSALQSPTTKSEEGKLEHKTFYPFRIFKNILLPCHRDARVQIVELGSAKCNLLVLFTISRLHLQLHQLLLYPLNCLLLGLHSPIEASSTQGYKCAEKVDNYSSIPNL